MVSKQHKNRLFIARIIFEKRFPVIFLCFGCKTTNPDHFENRVSSHQIIMFVHAVCALVGFVIYLYRNLFVNNDCGFELLFNFWFILMKRIEKTKNRVKSDLEVTIKAIDSKHVEIFSAIESANSKRKKMNLLFNILGQKTGSSNKPLQNKSGCGKFGPLLITGKMIL